MDGRTLNTLTGNRFPMIFGEEAPHLNLPYLEYVRTENGSLKNWASSAEEYARSLEQDNKTLRQNFEEVQSYALALRAELDKAQAAAPAPVAPVSPSVEPGGWRGWRDADPGSASGPWPARTAREVTARTLDPRRAVAPVRGSGPRTARRASPRA